MVGNTEVLVSNNVMLRRCAVRTDNCILFAIFIQDQSLNDEAWADECSEHKIGKLPALAAVCGEAGRLSAVDVARAAGFNSRLQLCLHLSI